MVSNLVPRENPDVGAESHYIDSHLLDKAGRLRDLKQVAKEIGDLSAQFAFIDYELREHLRRPMTRGYPPKIFISYRRETQSMCGGAGNWREPCKTRDTRSCWTCWKSRIMRHRKSSGKNPCAARSGAAGSRRNNKSGRLEKLG